MELQPMSRWMERFHEYISGLRVCRVMVPTPSPMYVISASERPGGVRTPCGYGSDSVAFRVAPLSSDQGTAESVLKPAPVWPETVARESRKNLPAPATPFGDRVLHEPEHAIEMTFERAGDLLHRLEPRPHSPRVPPGKEPVDGGLLA